MLDLGHLGGGELGVQHDFREPPCVHSKPINPLCVLQLCPPEQELFISFENNLLRVVLNEDGALEVMQTLVRLAAAAIPSETPE